MGRVRIRLSLACLLCAATLAWSACAHIPPPDRPAAYSVSEDHSLNLPHQFPEVESVKLDRQRVMTFYFCDGDRMKMFEDQVIYILLSGGTGAVVVEGTETMARSFESGEDMECPSRYLREKISRYYRYQEEMMAREQVREYLNTTLLLTPHFHHWLPPE